MDNQIEIRRVSALAGHYNPGKTGIIEADDTTGLVLQNMPDLELYQVAAWPSTIDKVSTVIARAAGVLSAPGPCQAQTGTKGSLLRIDPVKWWLYGIAAPQLKPNVGATLDLSHSRTHIRISGRDAVNFLNRQLPLDLRERSFAKGSVASSFIHHVGVTLWHSDAGYEMFIPRGFALFLWEGFVEVAAQFGLAIVGKAE